MEQKKFEGLLVLIVPQVVHLIAERCEMDEVCASQAFYNSKVYSALEDEETKLWHFSPQLLFDMFDEERRTGVVPFPEEG